jgi:hypothetical protein
MMGFARVLPGFLLAGFLASGAFAAPPWMQYPDVRDEPKVLFVKLWRFKNQYWYEITFEHDDTGWDHYVDYWTVVDDRNRPIQKIWTGRPTPGGWPFKHTTRSLVVPTGVNTLVFKAHCKIHGMGTQWVTVDLTKKSGGGFEIEIAPEWKGSSRPGDAAKFFRKEFRGALDWYW